MRSTPPIRDLGWQAVDATLPATDGSRRAIFGSGGPNGLVVAFVCNHCPYVKALVSRIVRDARDLRAEGVGFVAISSNDATAYPEDSFANMARFAAAHSFDFPYLYDEDQAVAAAFGAACTPDFFGLDKAFRLRYRGRLDASRKQAEPATLRRDLFEAMKEIARTGMGPRDQVAAIGCSIKWKDAA